MMNLDLLILKIFTFCMFEIDPDLNKKDCSNYMSYCIKISSFNNCSNFWKPLDWDNPDMYTGDPSEADYSY